MNAEELAPLDCATCPPSRKEHLACPDTGARRPATNLIPLGNKGSARTSDTPHAFDQCPRYWLRSPIEWGNVPWAVDVRTAHRLAIETRYAYEHGMLGVPHDALPGKLNDAVFLLLAEENRLSRLDLELARRASKTPERPGMTTERWA